MKVPCICNRIIIHYCVSFNIVMYIFVKYSCDKESQICVAKQSNVLLIFDNTNNLENISLSYIRCWIKTTYCSRLERESSNFKYSKAALTLMSSALCFKLETFSYCHKCYYYKCHLILPWLAKPTIFRNLFLLICILFN